MKFTQLGQMADARQPGQRDILLESTENIGSVSSVVVKLAMCLRFEREGLKNWTSMKGV